MLRQKNSSPNDRVWAWFLYYLTCKTLRLWLWITRFRMQRYGHLSNTTNFLSLKLDFLSEVIPVLESLVAQQPIDFFLCEVIYQINQADKSRDSLGGGIYPLDDTGQHYFRFNTQQVFLFWCGGIPFRHIADAVFVLQPVRFGAERGQLTTKCFQLADFLSA